MPPSTEYHPELRRALTHSQGLALERNNGLVTPAHVLLGMLDAIERDDHHDDSEAALFADILMRCGAAPAEVRAYTEAFLEGEPLAPPGDSRFHFSPATKALLELAYRDARDESSEHLNPLLARPVLAPEHVLVALLASRIEPDLAQMLEPLGLTEAEVRRQRTALQHAAHAERGASPLDHLNEASARALDAAHAVMRTSYCGRISTLHLLLGILTDEGGEVVDALQSQNISVEALRDHARRALHSDGEIAAPQRRFTSGAKIALERARAAAKRREHHAITPAHLLAGLRPRRASLRESFVFGTDAEREAVLVLAALDGNALENALRAALATEKVGRRKRRRSHGSPAPKLNPFRRNSNLKEQAAFLVPAVWTFASSALDAGRHSFHPRIALFNLGLFAWSGLMAMAAMRFARQLSTKQVCFNVFLGFLAGLLLLMCVLMRMR